MNTLGMLAEDEKLAQLTGEARDRRWPNLRPVDAATLIVLDRSGTSPRVLMGKRHDGHKFMPGKFVFPGGRTERLDSSVPLASDLTPSVVQALMTRTPRASLVGARRLALAALRETFEETGIIIGTKQDAIRGKAPLTGPWADFLGSGYVPDLAAIRFHARAITPPRRPKRFDTRFFIVEAERISHQIDGVVSTESELTELAWLTLKETADLPLPAITRVILADLDAAMRQEASSKPVVSFYYERNRIFQRDLIEINPD